MLLDRLKMHHVTRACPYDGKVGHETDKNRKVFTPSPSMIFDSNNYYYDNNRSNLH